MIDQVWEAVRRGEHEAFGAWVAAVEPQLRASLRSYARHVDVEAVVQEGLLRMWVLAPTRELDGPESSVRFALVLVRNLARREAARRSRFAPLPEDGGEPAHPAPPRLPDPALRAAVRDCLKKLPEKPRLALGHRLTNRDGAPDAALAARARMTLNTFLQNVVRARRALEACLEGRGIRVQEYLS